LITPDHTPCRIKNKLLFKLGVNTSDYVKDA
jgi:hypothetical protein